MPVISVEISDETAELIEKLLANCNGESNPKPEGDLTIETLTVMLLKDCALAHRRPGSWEGNNMIGVLTSHGYEP